MTTRRRLTDEQVREMRAMYQKWKTETGYIKGYGALARIFGCSLSTARDIVTYKIWKGIR